MIFLKSNFFLSYFKNEKASISKLNNNLIMQSFQKESAYQTKKPRKTLLQEKKIIKTNYWLESFQKSNQDTPLLHKPAVFEGQWVQSGDLLADCSTSVGGDLSLGQNLLIGYMPWEGYNFEDAILISERLVYDDLYTSIYIERCEIEIKKTELGIEQLTREIPDITKTEVEHLDKNGIAKIGTWVQEGDILVGKITPIKKKEESPYKKLLYTILEKQFVPVRDSSLRAAKGAKAKVIQIKVFKTYNFTINEKKKEKQKVAKFSNKTKNNFSQTIVKTELKKNSILKLSTKSSSSLPKNRKITKKKKSLKKIRINPFKKNSFLKKRIFSSFNNFAIKGLNLNFFKFQKKQSHPFFTRNGLDLTKNTVKKLNFFKNSIINQINKNNLIIQFRHSKIINRKKKIKLNLAKIYSKKKFLYFLIKTSNKFSNNLVKKLAVSFFSKNKPYFTPHKSLNLKLPKISLGSCYPTTHRFFQAMQAFSFYKKARKPKTKLAMKASSFSKFIKSKWKNSQNKIAIQENYPRLNLTFPISCNQKNKKQSKNKSFVVEEKKLDILKFPLKIHSASAKMGLKKKHVKSSLQFLYIENLIRIIYHKSISKQRNRISQALFKYSKPQRLFFLKNKIKTKTTIKAFNGSISSIHIYLADKRKIQVGDKMSGRHGNKGIVSQILPREDMPYLPDGTPLDMVLNPLGVPSRMNVGQIYECLLGFAGKYLGEKFQVLPFDEIYGPEASRNFVYSKLYEARIKTGINWLYDPNNPGKMKLYDGRTGDCFDQPITVGQSYILRLVHMVDDKIHARSIGPYSLITQQPLRGRSKKGGQRLGEMEVWALEGYGAAFTLLEMLTIKSDDMTGRVTLWSKFLLEKDLSIGTPESFKVLVCELQALCLDIGLFRPNPLKTYRLEKIENLITLR